MERARAVGSWPHREGSGFDVPQYLGTYLSMLQAPRRFKARRCSLVQLEVRSWYVLTDLQVLFTGSVCDLSEQLVLPGIGADATLKYSAFFRAASSASGRSANFPSCAPASRCGGTARETRFGRPPACVAARPLRACRLAGATGDSQPAKRAISSACRSSTSRLTALEASALMAGAANGRSSYGRPTKSIC